MKAFEIWINDEKKFVAGLGDNTMSAIVDLWRDQANLHVGGMIERDGNDHHVDWGRETLREGDELRIRLIETENVDAPHQQKQSETRVERDTRIRDQLVEARDLLPSPATETGTATLALFEERLTQKNFPTSMHILAELGQENKISAAFWKALGQAAFSQSRYEESRQYRARCLEFGTANEDNEADEHTQ